MKYRVRSMQSPVRFSIAVLMAALGLVVPVYPQTDQEVNAGIQFNFSTPGARSLGLGGAFLGLADDATAAFTNPAGLVNLSQQEVALELRAFDFNTNFVEAGHNFGPPRVGGVDTIAGLSIGETSESTENVSFLSFVQPVGNWRLALYRHQLADFKGGFRTQGTFFDPFPAVQIGRLDPAVVESDLEIVTYGLSTAMPLSRRESGAVRVALGVGVAYYDFDFESRSARLGNRVGSTAAVNRPQNDPGGVFGPPIYSSDEELTFAEERGADEDMGFNVGLLWRIRELAVSDGKRSPGVSLGAVYRKGPEFDLFARNRVGALGSRVTGLPTGSTIVPSGGGFVEGTFNVPDVYGLGVAVQATRKVRLTADWDRVEYSSLTEDSIITLFPDPSPAQIAAVRRVQAEDANEVHLGFEYLWQVCPSGRDTAGECSGRELPIALRTGGWRDPDHRVAFTGAPGTDASLRAQATQFADIGQDEIHFAAGIGFIFGAFSLDAAVDLSDLVDTGALSFVFSF